MPLASRPLAAVLAFVALGPVAAAAPVPQAAKPSESPAAKARKALNDPADFRFDQASLDDLARFVRGRFGVELTIDVNALAQMGMNANAPVLNANLKAAKLRDGLKAALAPVGLRFAVTAEGLVVSSDEGITQLQMRQRVSLDGGGRPLAAVLTQLAADTGANLVLDPRQAKKAGETPVALTLDDTPLEAAVRLVAEVAGLRAVRLSNVLFVTSEDRAEKLRPDADAPVPPAPANPVAPPTDGPFAPVLPAGAVAVPMPVPQPLPPPPDTPADPTR